MKSELNEIPLIGWIGIAFILMIQGIYLFLDARKRGHNPWIWGILGMIQAPMPTIIYLLFVRGYGKKIWKGVKKLWKS